MGLLRDFDTVVSVELHMRHGINVEALPESTDWHWLGHRILWLYHQRGAENTPASDTRKAVHHGRV